MEQNNFIARDWPAHYVGTWEHYDTTAIGQSEICVIILKLVNTVLNIHRNCTAY